MATRDILLIVVAFALIGLTVFFLYRGCSCLATKPEGFENAGEDADAKLNKDELALFEDLKADKYSAKEIDEMVAKGVIDQNLVEKFLNKLDTFEAIEAEEEEEEEEEQEEPKVMKKKPKKKAGAAPKKK